MATVGVQITTAIKPGKVCDDGLKLTRFSSLMCYVNMACLGIHFIHRQAMFTWHVKLETVYYYFAWNSRKT